MKLFEIECFVFVKNSLQFSDVFHCAFYLCLKSNVLGFQMLIFNFVDDENGHRH